jgi:hypothetical protein
MKRRLFYNGTMYRRFEPVARFSQKKGVFHRREVFFTEDIVLVGLEARCLCMGKHLCSDEITSHDILNNNNNNNNNI